MTTRFLSEAEAELALAVAHYNSQRAALGTEFASEIRDGLKRIEANPEAWQLVGRRVRRYRLHRFPYAIIYAPVQTEIVVLAIMHLHRKPNYWQDRLTQM